MDKFEIQSKNKYIIEFNPRKMNTYIKHRNVKNHHM